MWKSAGKTLLNVPVVRLFRSSSLFRITFLSAALLLTGISILVIFLWKTSIHDPRRPEITVSRLRALQSWALRRSAEKAVAAGRLEDAISAWGAAVAANPTNPELARGLLRTILRLADPRPLTQTAEEHCLWLLALSVNEEADVELAAQVYEKFRFYSSVTNLLQPREDRLSRPLQRVYLKALLNVGQASLFARRWEDAKQWLETDAEMQLYHAAYLAGWGPPSTADQGQRQLAAAQEDPLRRAEALRLQLVVSGHRKDVTDYSSALGRLAELRADAVAEEVAYWGLLALSGQKDTAQRRAEQYPFPPGNAEETACLTRGYVQLGMRDAGEQLLRRYLSQFAYASGLWLLYANLLIEDRDWDGLWGLALRMRQEMPARGRLEGYSYYLEGRAEVERKRIPLAKAAFERAADSRFEEPRLAMQVAQGMLALDYPAPAGKMLDRVAKGVSKSPAYWQLVFAVACALKQADNALRAATALYELIPDDPVTVNNYAGVLLTLRQRPDEAIKLTMLLVAKLPGSLEARINHSLALILNERTPEARTLLQTIDPDHVPATYLTAYYQTWLEVYLKQHDFERARQASERINTNQLFPCEIQWLNAARKQIATNLAHQPKRE